MTVKKIFITMLPLLLFAERAYSADWELRVDALTETMAVNSLFLGQKDDATDGFDGMYDVPAFIEGSISAYFPHDEWNEVASKYWRDTKASDPQKSWAFTVESSASTITLSWEISDIPDGYSFTLSDTLADISIDMNTQDTYAYANSGPRQFTIDTAAPVDVTPPSTGASPAGGIYVLAQSVTLTADEEATIYYTTDGSEPTTSSTVYLSPVDIAATTTLKFSARDTAGNEEAAKTEEYIVGSLANLSGDTGSGSGGDDLAGVSRSDGGNDSNNLSGGKAKVDVEYIFSIVFIDDTGESPQLEPKLYLAHRSSPVEGAGGDFFFYDTNCTGLTWGTGKTCTATLKLGPAAAHKYYFKATKSDGTTVRLPSSGYSNGPAVRALSGYAMVSAPRDVDSENLAGTEAFARKTYRWVSTGLDAEYNTSFSGYWEAVTSANPVRKGEAYFAIGGSSTLPELSSYNDNSDASYTITLQPGWNMIGNQYNGNVKLEDITVKKGPAGADETWTAATSNEWVYNTLWYYNGSDWGGTWGSEFAPGAELVPWVGYYIYLKKNDDTYYLTIPKP